MTTNQQTLTLNHDKITIFEDLNESQLLEKLKEQNLEYFKQQYLLYLKYKIPKKEIVIVEREISSLFRFSEIENIKDEVQKDFEAELLEGKKNSIISKVKNAFFRKRVPEETKEPEYNIIIPSQPKDLLKNLVAGSLAPHPFIDDKIKVANELIRCSRNTILSLNDQQIKQIYCQLAHHPHELIVFEKLLAKRNTLQLNSVKMGADTIVSAVPLAGGLISARLNVTADNALIALENSLTLEEHFEICEQNQNRYMKMFEDIGVEKDKLEESLNAKGNEVIKLKEKVNKINKDFVNLKELRKQELLQQEEQTKNKLKALGIEQNKLQTKEKIEFTQLQQKHQELEKNCSTSEAKTLLLQKKLTDLLNYIEQLETEKRILFLEYERLESDWTLKLKSANSFKAETNFLQNQIDILQIEIDSLKEESRIEKKSAEYYKSTASKHALDWNEETKKVRAKEIEIIHLELKIANLEKELQDQTRKTRIGMLANICQGLIDYLPISKKWRETAKTSIQAGSAYALIKDLPSWTYELLIAIFTLSLFFALRTLKRKLWPNKQVSNLEKALENVVLKQDQQSNSNSNEVIDINN